MKLLNLPEGWTLSKQYTATQVHYDLSGRTRKIKGYDLKDPEGYTRFVDNVEQVKTILLNHGYENF
jgi:hypothetical protein